MVTRFTKHKLFDVLNAIAEGELKAEYSRQALADKQAFEPYTAFKRIASPTSMDIASTDLCELFLDSKIYLDRSDADHLIKLFDSNRDRKLSYSKFLNAVLPKSDASLRFKATSRRAHDLEEGGRLPYDVERALIRFFEEEIISFQQVEVFKKELSCSYDYNTSKAFKSIDYDNKGYLTPADIANFANELAQPFSQKSIEALFRRVDLDHDGRISHSEFSNAVSSLRSDISFSTVPRSPSQKSNSPRHIRDISSERRKPYESPIKSVLKDGEYRNYLSESKRRSSSPKRIEPEQKDIFRTPTKNSKRLDESIVSSKKKTLLKGNGDEELTRLFKQIINSTKSLESAKNELAFRSDFNLLDAFRYFDLDGSGAYVNSKQFEQGLANLKLFPSKEQVSCLFNKLGRDYNGYFRFTDFSNLITPKSKEFAVLLTSRKPRYVESSEQIFTRETERVFIKVLGLALENEALAESVRQKLNRRPLFNNYKAFKAIDKYEQGFITQEDLTEILEANGISAMDKDIGLLLDHLKGNEGNDRKISFSEFSKELSPKTYKVF